MMTIAQARALVGQSMGLRDFDGSIDAYRNLTAAQQIDLTKRLFDYIKANPANFTETQKATVAAEDSRIQTATVQDTSFDWGQFMQEFEQNAYTTVAEPLVNIGRGVSTSVNLIGTLLPIAVLAAVVIFALPYVRKASKS
jgi:hypothetical protein